MTAARPGGEQQQQARTEVGRDGVSLLRFETDHRPGTRGDRLVRRVNTHFTIDDHDERGLLHLVVTEFLAGIEADQNRTRFVVRMENNRRPASARCLNLQEIPAPHDGGS